MSATRGRRYPCASRRREGGGEARGLRRAAAQGDDWEALLHLPAPYAFCDARSQKIGVTASLARAAVEEIADSAYR